MQIITKNRKAYFNYEIIEEIEAGIMLLGSEVKAIREGKVNINDSYASEINGELFLSNSLIGFYKGSNQFNHAEKRPRKLLLHHKELQKIIGQISIKGLSLIPTKLYFNKRNLVKISLALAKGKKLYDKRRTIKERDDNRRKQRGED